MLEDFIEMYADSDSLILDSMREVVDYGRYEIVFFGLGVLAIIFEVVKNAVKEQKFTISNQYIVSILLLTIVGGALKPTLDGLGYIGKQMDQVSRITEEQKDKMTVAAISNKNYQLTTEIDTLLKHNGGNKWDLEVLEKKMEIWTGDLRRASTLMGNFSPMGINTGGIGIGFSIERAFDELLGAVRVLLKIYYVGMLNILYLIIPLSYVFSVFKPSHFLKPLGIFVLMVFVLSILNLIEYVIFEMFLAESVNGGIGSMIFSGTAMLFNLLSAFLYLRGMWVTRLVIPIPGEDTIGPMVGQALAMGTYMVMSKLSIPGAPAKPPAIGSENTGQGPVDITTK